MEQKVFNLLLPPSSSFFLFFFFFLIWNLPKIMRLESACGEWLKMNPNIRNVHLLFLSFIFCFSVFIFLCDFFSLSFFLLFFLLFIPSFFFLSPFLLFFLFLFFPHSHSPLLILLFLLVLLLMLIILSSSSFSSTSSSFFSVLFFFLNSSFSSPSSLFCFEKFQSFKQELNMSKKSLNEGQKRYFSLLSILSFFLSLFLLPLLYQMWNFHRFIRLGCM